MEITRVPRRGERVRVSDQQGTFIVVRVDKVGRVGTLERWADPGEILRDVPFGAIHRIREGMGEAA